MSRGPAEAVWHRNWAVNRLMWRTMARCGALARGRLLDLGCGDQPYRDLFAGRVTRYVGMERGRGRYLGSGVAVWGDALHLPFPDGSFDTVLSNQLLEHVREPARLLQEIGRILTPEGHLILTAPHIWGLHEQPDDYFRFTPYGLQHLAEEAGLEVLEVKALAGFWFTAGVRFCHYLARWERGVLRWPVRIPIAFIQLAALAMDRIHRVETDAWNHLLTARKPSAGTN